MIYLDSSVCLAALLSEDRAPPPQFWDQPSVSSRLLEYEVMNRLYAQRAGTSRIVRAEELLRQIELFDLASPILDRALRPFPLAVRTLDGLHLATALYVARAVPETRLASYDRRLLEAASAVGLDVFEP